MVGLLVSEVNMVSLVMDEILERAKTLTPAERLEIIKILASDMQTSLLVEETNPVLSPAEILASGLFGVWADKGIQDGAEWVNMRKQERHERQKQKWSTDS
jgi:hypothetical protein